MHSCMIVRVALNGTKINPFHRMGFKCNPFPQIAKYEYRHVDRALALLAAEPIPDTDHIRKVLAGLASDRFVNLCCEKFELGKHVEFTIEFPID